MRSADEDGICILEAIKTANMHREELAESLVDNAALEILAATARRELTVREVSAMTTIPLATCYKIVEKLASIGLLAETGKVRTSTRGKASMYTASLRSFGINLSDGLIEVHIAWKNGQSFSISKEVLAEVMSEMSGHMHTIGVDIGGK